MSAPPMLLHYRPSPSTTAMPSHITGTKAPDKGKSPGSGKNKCLVPQEARRWKEIIALRNRGKNRLSGPKSKPKLRPFLRAEPKAIAGRFYQLLSGHSMISSFPKEKRGWVESDQFWWCHRGRQSRKHLSRSAGDGRAGYIKEVHDKTTLEMLKLLEDNE